MKSATVSAQTARQSLPDRIRPAALAVRHLVGLSLLAGLALSAHAQSLVDLYQTAQGYDATYLSALAQYQANLAKADQARAGLLPTVGVSAAANVNNLNSSNDALDKNFNSQSAQLSASQPLYRPVNLITDEQARKSLAVAEAQLLSAGQELIVRTAQAYFDVLAAQDNQTFVQAQKTAVAEQLAAAKRNFEVGTSTITDTREAQARYDLVLAQEIATDNDLRVKQLALDQLVGKSGTTPWRLTPGATLPALDGGSIDGWVTDAESQSPQIRQAAAGLEIAQLETRKAQAGHQPTLDAVAQYQIARAPSSSGSSTANLRSNTASIGLQFNLPLFAGFAVQNRVRETLALEDKARQDLDAARRAVTQATRTAYYGVVSGQGQVKALEAAEASSQSALDANQLGYQVGVRINIDVLNAQSQLYQTKASLAKARYDLLLGGLKLRQASGMLKGDDLQGINALLNALSN